MGSVSRATASHCTVAITIYFLCSGTAIGQETSAARVHSIIMDPATIMDPAIELVDCSAPSGLEFVHEDGSTGQQYLPELMGAGAASLDFDNDSWIDVYLLNGHALSNANSAISSNEATPKRNGLFRNLRRMQFENVTENSKTGDQGYGLGVATADYDNDGFVDIYISNFGANSLLKNNGDGTFSNVTQLASDTASDLGDEQKFGAGVCWLDANQDGDLDLWVANYVDFTFESHARLAPRAFPFPPGPKDFPPLADSLYINNGDGTFTDRSAAAGIDSVAGPSMGVIAGDFDDDGDTDVFVANDGAANHYFRNDGNGVFDEAGIETGVALDLLGQANGSMGVDAADLNADGIDDLFVTDYVDQLPMLFLSYEAGGFEDQCRVTRIGTELRPHVNWSTGLVDFDNDGDRDVFVCNGHFLKNARDLTSVTDFAVANTLMQNVGGARFRPNDIGPPLPDEKAAVGSSRGAVFEDFDQDGDIDVVVLNCDAAAQLLRNDTPSQACWLAIQLAGRNANRSAVGARVTVRFGTNLQTAEVRSGRGYQSHWGSRLHFGLGSNQVVEEITIDWPDGQQQQLLNAPANRVVQVVQPIPAAAQPEP